MSKEELELLKYVFSVAYGNCFSSEIEEIGKLENKLLKGESIEELEDLTLMFMYCEEKTKDKIKELQQRIDKAIGNWNTLKRHFEFLKINTTGGNKEFMEDILEIMNTLEGGNDEI